MGRREDLLAKVGDNEFLIKEVDELLFLEGQLEYLRSLPQIEVHPKHPERQRPTTAAKEYIKFLQQYNNVVRTLARATATTNAEEDDPLDAWLNEHRRSKKDNMDA